MLAKANSRASEVALVRAKASMYPFLAGLVRTSLVVGVMLVATGGATLASTFRAAPVVRWQALSEAIAVSQRGTLYFGGPSLAERCLTHREVRELRLRLRGVASLPARITLGQPRGSGAPPDLQVTTKWHGETRVVTRFDNRRKLPAPLRRLGQLLFRFLASHRSQLWFGNNPSRHRARPICHEQI